MKTKTNESALRGIKLIEEKFIKLGRIRSIPKKSETNQNVSAESDSDPK